MLEHSSGTSSGGMEGSGQKAVQVGHAEAPARCATALTATAGLAQPQTLPAFCPVHSGESNRTWKEHGMHLHQGPVRVLLAHASEMTLDFEVLSEGCSAVSQVR